LQRSGFVQALKTRLQDDKEKALTSEGGRHDRSKRRQYECVIRNEPVVSGISVSARFSWHGGEGDADS
jgi:hypothetical protein